VKEPSAKYLARPRYKQTEVGAIPEDWEVVSIGDIASFKSGDGIAVSELRQESADTPVPVYGGNGIAGYTANAVVREQVIVIGRVGQKCGEVYLTTGPAWITDNALYPRAFHRKLDLRYFALALKGAGLNDLKNRNDLPLVTQSILHSVRIPLPPNKVEQQAIAEAMSDADTFIESLEQLLVKKRQIKQGAMQELLTGKKRLPGFSGQWEVRALGQMATANKGSQLSTSEMSEHGIFAHLNGGMSPSGYTDKSNAPGNSIAISEGGNSCGYVQFMFEPYWCGGHCYSVIPKGADNRFLYHALKGEEPAIMGLRVGSGLPNVQKTALLALPIRCPGGNEEQTAIAAILSDMDAEISTFEEMLDKARQIKQGMMQELLTGRTRLMPWDTRSVRER